MSEHTTFFITGCASGIGRHLTDVLQKQGKKVFASDINIEGLRATAQELNWPEDRVFLAKLDVRDYEEWTAVWESAEKELGGIDVIINNSGILKAYWCHETPPEMVHLMVDVNVKGVMFGSQLACKHMMERKRGHIINVASMAGMAPITGQSVYSGSKYAARGYSLAIAEEMRKHNVKVTAICPAAVQTPLFAGQEKDEAAAMLFIADQLLTVEDIEDAILNKALKRQPLEVAVPAGLGMLARIANLMPWTGKLLANYFMNRGRKHQLKA